MELEQTLSNHHANVRPVVGEPRDISACKLLPTHHVRFSWSIVRCAGGRRSHAKRRPERALNKQGECDESEDQAGAGDFWNCGGVCDLAVDRSLVVPTSEATFLLLVDEFGC